MNTLIPALLALAVAAPLQAAEKIGMDDQSQLVASASKAPSEAYFQPSGYR